MTTISLKRPGSRRNAEHDGPRGTRKKRRRDCGPPTELDSSD